MLETRELKNNNSYFFKISFLKNFEIVVKDLEYDEKTETYFVKYFLLDQFGFIIEGDPLTKKIVNYYINDMLNKTRNA